MTSSLLRLHYSSTAQRDAAAWLVPGSNAADWLAALAELPTAHETVRILPLPNSAQRTIPSAALLVPEGEEKLPVNPHYHAYGWAAKQILVPIEATVQPPLTDAEWNSLLPDADALFVWHPASGLIRFDARDMLSAIHLLETPDVRTGDWNFAEEAPATIDRLREVTSAESPQSLEDLAQEWRAAIGAPKSIDELPPREGEPPLHWTERLADMTSGIRYELSEIRDWLAPALRPFQFVLPILSALWWLFKQLLKALLFACLMFLASRILGGRFGWSDFFLMLAAYVAGLQIWRWIQSERRKLAAVELKVNPSQVSVQEPSFLGMGLGGLGRLIGRAVSWITGQPTGQAGRGAGKSWLQQADELKRQREVDRLMELLDKNPDEGLRFAIPFGGDAARGQGFGGNELVARNLDYRGGGGGAVDPWNLNVAQQLALSERYRKLAEKEKLAGHFQRAASIYAHLLGDWSAAALALVAGRLYADAAVIYHRRLKNLAEAAKYYELAGQHDIALTLFLEQKQFREAGDLCRRIGRESQAEEHYRTAVAAFISSGEVRSAVEILETRLKDIDGALQVLYDTWPAHPNADVHLDQWFNLAARHQRHELASQRITTLSTETSMGQALRVLPRLQTVAQNYPHAEITRQAGESTLQLVSTHLPTADWKDSQRLVWFLPPLIPTDRLLRRDCERFIERRRDQAPVVPNPEKTKRQTLRLMRQFTLPDIELLQPICSWRHGWIALTDKTGPKLQQLLLIPWSGPFSLVEVPADLITSLIAVDERDRRIWLTHKRGTFSVQWPEQTQTFAAINAAGVPKNWLAANLLPLGSAQTLWLDDQGAPWISFHWASYLEGESKSHRVAREWLADPELTPLYFRGRAAISSTSLGHHRIYLPISHNELLIEEYDGETIVHTPRRFEGCHVACQNGFDAALICHETGVRFLDSIFNPTIEKEFPNWENPRAAFLGPDLFVIADNRRIAIYRQEDASLRLEIEHQAAEPLAIAHVEPGKLSLLRTDHKVQLWNY